MANAAIAAPQAQVLNARIERVMTDAALLCEVASKATAALHAWNCAREALESAPTWPELQTKIADVHDRMCELGATLAIAVEGRR